MSTPDRAAPSLAKRPPQTRRAIAEVLRCLCAAACVLVATACTSTPPSHQAAPEQAVIPEPTRIPILPSATDPNITQFNDPHGVYIDRGIVVDRRAGSVPPRGELLVWLGGTGGRQQGAQGFANLAAGLGYHVVTLVYSNDIPATSCARDRDPNAFENFRLAIIRGGSAGYQNGRGTLIIERHDSIEHRLTKLLEYLQQHRPEEGWGQFLDAHGGVRWESVAVAGQSQGGGHAALIGIKHRVARVMCFGAPKDYSKALDAPAAWYGNVSATPKERFFAFNHRQDPIGCTPEQLMANLRALGLDAYGPPADVDVEVHPYRRARLLYTNHPAVLVEGVDSEGARTAHGSAINTRNADRWKAVWTYMLTDPLP